MVTGSTAGIGFRAEVAELAIGQFDQADILVNNLGVYAAKPFEQIEDAVEYCINRPAMRPKVSSSWLTITPI